MASSATSPPPSAACSRAAEQFQTTRGTASQRGESEVSSREAVPGNHEVAALIQLKRMKRVVAESSEDGQALVEYALIVGSIALLAVGSLQLLGGNVSALLNEVASGFGAV